MMKWWKSLFRNRKGFTLVELICSIALFSIIMTSVGSALVISARSYQRGNVEVGLQQQAQIASNLLTNLIIDSDKVVQASDGKLEVEKVESGVIVTYTVFLDGGELKYYTSVDPTERTLAENITEFVINRAEGENVDFSLTVETGGRSYASNYHVTPRNGVSSGGTVLSGTISLFAENELVLEPGQTYDLNVRISGTTDTGFTVDSSTDGDINSSETKILIAGETDPDTNPPSTVPESCIRIKVGRTETDSFHFRVISDADSTVSRRVTVHIRRINDISVNGYKISGGGNCSAGAEYKVSAVLTGTYPPDYLQKQPGAWYDVDYVDPYTNKWEFEFTDDSGNKQKWHLEDGDVNEYIKITGDGTDAGNIPYVTFKLKRDMTAGCSFKVTGTALHPEGVNPDDATNMTNKSGVHYGRLADPTDSVSHSWTLKQQAWKRNGKLDIAVHHLGDENFWDWDGEIMYKWEARVKFIAYDSEGNFLTDLAGDFDPWQREQHLPIKADIDLSNIRDKWDLVLMPYHETNNVWDWGPSYSLPCIVAYYNNAAFDQNYYLYNAGPYFTNTKLGVAGYNIELTYQYMDESGVLQTETINENYDVEEVSVLYRNALDAGCSWQRDNKIFVTTADTITDYKVHFQFDRGWDEDDHDYYFIDLKRFVGVVADRPGYVNDIRRDITVTGNEVKKAVPDGDSVLTFTLTAADKAECKALADTADGTISMIYEYNPYLGRLPLKEKSNDELLAENPSWADNFWAHKNSEIPADPLNPRWYKEYDMPLNVRGVTLTQDMLDSIKGCEGKVIFCFKDPNITGATLKTMYCPTITEYGPLYYIDDTSRFVIAAGAAQYQELVGGTWTTIVNLTWNGSGWTA